MLRKTTAGSFLVVLLLVTLSLSSPQVAGTTATPSLELSPSDGADTLDNSTASVGSQAIADVELSQFTAPMDGLNLTETNRLSPLNEGSLSSLLTSNLPAWTYKSDLVTVMDPVNIVFYGAPWTTVRDALIGRGWWDPGLCQFDEYVYYDGSWRKQDVGLVIYEATPCAFVAFSVRLHIRLWGLSSSLVLGAVHWDYMPYPGPPIREHVAILYEEAEEEVGRQMRLTDSSPWRVQDDYNPEYLNNHVDEYRESFHTFNNAFPTTLWRQTGASANIYDGQTTTLLGIPNWGGIRDFNSNKVQVYSISGAVRWSLWYAQAYSSGTVTSGGVGTVSYPHWTAWMMTIWRHEASSAYMGTIMCKENDGTLGCVTLSGGKTVNVGNSVEDTIFEVPTFAKVRDTGSSGDNRRVVVQSYGGYVEWALWHKGSYIQGEASPYGTSYVTFPHAKFFMLYAWRMNVEQQYWTGDNAIVLLCREDSNILGCMVHSTGVKANTADSTVDTLNLISAIGGVRDTGDPVKNHVVTIYASSSSAIEGAYWTEGGYTGQDAPSGQTREFTFSHYRFFVFVAARYGRLIWLFCRENDNKLGCIPARWF